jgi:hypothetical protein
MKDFDGQNLRSLEILVDELIKDMPQEEIVRTQMEAIGLEYKLDPVERLNAVLQALQFNEPKKTFGQES